MKRWTRACACAFALGMTSATAVSAGPGPLTFNEAIVQFGAVAIRQSSSPKVIAISNTTNRPAFITGINTTEDFTQSNNCVMWLAQGAGCLVFVTFTPGRGGQRSGTLIVETSDQAEQTLSLTGFGVQSEPDALARTDHSTMRVTNDEERAHALINDKRYSFEALLNKNPEDIANAERVFSLTSDSAGKLRIASILVSRGSTNPVYSNYLIAEAETALQDASEFPWPFLYDERKHPVAPNLALNDWCRAHNISFWDMEHVEYYEISTAWYYLAHAGDPRAYALLLKGLRSTNLMIAALAARGLAKLGDQRAVDELIAAGHETTGEALWGIAQSLIFFPDPKAQAAADDLCPEAEKRLLALFRGEASKRGLRALFQW